MAKSPTAVMSEAPKEAETAKEQLYPCTPSTLRKLLEHMLSEIAPDGAKKPMATPMIWGAPGIGKTEIVRQLAKSWGYAVVALHLPQYDPTDIKGVVVRMANDVVRWVPTSYLPQQLRHHVLNESRQVSVRWPNVNMDRDVWVRVLNKDKELVAVWNNDRYTLKNPMHVQVKKTQNEDGSITFDLEFDRSVFLYEVQIIEKAILFLDELSAADPGTQNAALQLVLDRRVNEYDVPSGVPIVAAGNRESDGGFIQQMSLPLANRFCHLLLEPTVDDFIAHLMESGIRFHPDMLSFISQIGKEALFHYNADTLTDGKYGFNTPRSWVNLHYQYHDDLPENIRNSMIVGYIGSKIGNELILHIKTCGRDLPSTVDILEGRKVDMSRVDRMAYYSLVMRLLYKLRDYYEDHYQKGIKADQQPEQWQTAVNSFFKFIDTELTEEISLFVLFILTPMKFTVADLRSPAFNDFSGKHMKTYERIRKNGAFIKK